MLASCNYSLLFFTDFYRRIVIEIAEKKRNNQQTNRREASCSPLVIFGIIIAEKKVFINFIELIIAEKNWKGCGIKAIFWSSPEARVREKDAKEPDNLLGMSCFYFFGTEFGEVLTDFECPLFIYGIVRERKHIPNGLQHHSCLWLLPLSFRMKLVENQWGVEKTFNSNWFNFEGSSDRSPLNSCLKSSITSNIGFLLRIFEHEILSGDPLK